MIPNTWSRGLIFAAVLTLAGIGAPGALADENPEGGSGKDASAAPATATPAPTMEEALREQGEMLRQMREMMLEQQKEIERLRTELDSVRRGDAATVSSASGAATSGTPASAGAVSATAVPAVDVAGTSASATAQSDEDLRKKVDDLTKRWGSLKFSGDLRFRFEGFYNQGFDALQDVKARNRERFRLRAQLTHQINNHFDWAFRIASGSFDDPISTNQTIDNFYDRKPFAIDRAFLHYTTASKPANLELYAGKFDYTWKRTPLTFDNDLQPEGASEVVKFSFKDSPLVGLQLTAWQLPFKERSVGADAYIVGGQILTDWKWSDHWSTGLSGAFHDFEQVQILPQFVNVSSTLVNAGFDYGTTNTVVINPFTGLPEYRSDYRVIDAIADLKYTGFGDKWPLIFRADWIHNTSSYNNQKDGGLAMVELGRRSAEKDDLGFMYEFYKIEREAFPSVFNESDILQTNGLNHRVTVSYTYLKNVVFEGQYILSRRLQTTSPENRWLNRIQLDVIYKF